ncbi:uncharacterized protein LOC112572753 [Pomacea canaliculata]|nr:uncharacterized protein LOC112572753 [Pomacea canaliculata]
MQACRRRITDSSAHNTSGPVSPHTMTATCVTVLVMVALLPWTACSQDQGGPVNSTCLVRDSGEERNSSVVTCQFPTEISNFRVDLYHENGSSRDPVIVCSPCHVAEEFSGLITLLFPDNQTADTWSFEVLGSRDTAGRYTCHGGQWLETFQSLPCSIPFTLEDTASNAASINITKDNSRSSNEILLWILIPTLNIFLVVSSVTILCCFLYRCRLLMCIRETTACKEQYAYQAASRGSLL